MWFPLGKGLLHLSQALNPCGEIFPSVLGAHQSILYVGTMGTLKGQWTLKVMDFWVKWHISYRLALRVFNFWVLFSLCIITGPWWLLHLHSEGSDFWWQTLCCTDVFHPSWRYFGTERRTVVTGLCLVYYRPCGRGELCENSISYKQGNQGDY